jgi:rhamnose transport system ATP-binding protein
LPNDPILQLDHVTKQFPGVRALHDVALSLYPGQVTALLGENGAGKSTIVKILTGIYRPDAGAIHVGGKLASFMSPRDAWAKGITAIHQETVMFDDLTVAENIFMGHMPVEHGRIVNWKAMRERAAALLKRVDADFGADIPLKRLGVAQKHLVEIARALSHDSKIVIMDEPTSALSAHEIDDLFRIVDQLKAEGRAVLFISHKFDEIFRVADRWVCLRDGEHVGDGLIGQVKQAELVKLMVGRSIDQVFPKRQVTIGEPVLEVDGLSSPTEFADVSFTLRKGEILGFYGLVGAGRSETMQALFGVSTPSKGSVKLKGNLVSLKSAAEAIAAGIAYVPEDRQVQGTVLPLGIRENITLASLAQHVNGLFLSKDSEREVTRKLGQRLSIKAANWEQRLGELSGGNQQKVVISKWLATNPQILILDEPTKGIDIGSKSAVHEFMGELVAGGLAIILVTSELPEVMGMADRIMVMYEGRIVRSFARGEATAEQIVTAATGGSHS